MLTWVMAWPDLLKACKNLLENPKLRYEFYQAIKTCSLYVCYVLLYDFPLYCQKYDILILQVVILEAFGSNFYKIIDYIFFLIFHYLYREPTEDLKYLNIDYTQFNGWSSDEEVTIYTGIEKGYEQWVLEGPDDNEDKVSIVATL